MICKENTRLKWIWKGKEEKWLSKVKSEKEEIEEKKEVNDWNLVNFFLILFG
jgi:hypothetical protein